MVDESTPGYEPVTPSQEMEVLQNFRVALGACSACTFAGYWPPERPGQPDRLVCHRYPHMGGGWPFMQPDDWCGEFKEYTR